MGKKDKTSGGRKRKSASSEAKGRDGSDEEDAVAELDEVDNTEDGDAGGDAGDEENDEEEVMQSSSSYSSSSARKKAKSVDPLKKHKNEMADLAAADPDFYKFLQENDAGLLDFGKDLGDDDDDEDDEEGDNEGDESADDGDDNDDDDDDDDDNDDDDDDDDDEDEDDVNEQQSSVIAVTSEIIQSSIGKAMKSRKGIKQTLAIFAAACNPNFHGRESSDDYSDLAANRYIITSGSIHDEVMTTVVDKLYLAFYNTLKIEFISPISTRVIEKNSGWKKVKMFVMSFFKSYLSTLMGLLEADRDGSNELASYLINSLANYIPLLALLPSLTRRTLKVLLAFWSKDIKISDDSSNLRGYSFLRIRQMALQLPGATKEECFRNIYLTFARNCKVFSENTSESIVFMSQSIAELYISDVSISYQQGFLYIRQLSLLLRNALIKMTSEAIRQITTWQFLNCFRLWTRVICAMPGQDELGALVFPLTQVAFGILSIASSIYYIPLRFHLIICLQQICASAKVFIPLAPRLLEILEHPDITGKPTPTTDTPPNLSYLVKLAPDSISKSVVRDVIIDETASLLRIDAELYRYNPGVPEYFHLTIRKVKSFIKQCKVSRWRDLLKTVTGQMEQYAAYAKSKRIELDKSVILSVGIEPLLPNGTPDMKARVVKLLSGRGNGSINEITVSAFTPSAQSDSKASSKVSTKLSASDSKGMMNGLKNILDSSKSKKPISKSNDDYDDDDSVEETPTDKGKKKKKSNKKDKEKSRLQARAMRASSASGGDRPDELGEGVDWSDDDF